jgi:hypothetical protein
MTLRVGKIGHSNKNIFFLTERRPVIREKTGTIPGGAGARLVF